MARTRRNISIMAFPKNDEEARIPDWADNSPDGRPGAAEVSA